MNWEAIGAVGEILGALAVVISLIYLSVQIKQSNNLSKSNTRRDMVRSDQSQLYKIIDFPDIYDSFYKEDITRAEKVRLHEWLVANMRNREFDWFQRKNGLIDVEVFESYRKITQIVLAPPRARRWWNVHRASFDPDFATDVDELLTEKPAADHFGKFDDW